MKAARPNLVKQAMTIDGSVVSKNCAHRYVVCVREARMGSRCGGDISDTGLRSHEKRDRGFMTDKQTGTDAFVLSDYVARMLDPEPRMEWFEIGKRSISGLWVCRGRGDFVSAPIDSISAAAVRRAMTLMELKKGHYVWNLFIDSTSTMAEVLLVTRNDVDVLMGEATDPDESIATYAATWEARKVLAS